MNTARGPTFLRSEIAETLSALAHTCTGHAILVERFFNRIKQCRRIATRYDKLAANYLAFIKLASIRIWLRAYESTPWVARQQTDAQTTAAASRQLTRSGFAKRSSSER